IDVHDPHHIRIKNCEIIGGGEQGILVVAEGPNLPVGSNEFIGNMIHDSLSNNEFFNAFYINSSDNLIEGNTIYNYPGAGIQIYNGYAAGFANNNIIRNNIVHDSGVPGFRGQGIIVASGNNDLIYNNIIYNLTPGATAGGSGGIILYS